MARVVRRLDLNLCSEEVITSSLSYDNTLFLGLSEKKTSALINSQFLAKHEKGVDLILLENRTIDLPSCPLVLFCSGFGPDWKTMELTGEQLKQAETQLKMYLPRSQPVYGTLVLRNRVKSDSMQILVDSWPEFRVIVCKPHCQQDGDHFKDILVYANDEAVLKETIRKSSVIDWTKFFCVGINQFHGESFTAVASEINVPSHKLAVCHMMTLEDVSKLPSIDSSGICLSSLDESHIGLVNQTWKFGQDEVALRMIHNMIANFPSCCVLGAEREPVSWILTYQSCAMGMLYTLPEHRGKGYAKALVSTMARRLHAEGYPVYCFIEEENVVSYSLFKNLGFTEDPSYRETWFSFDGI